MLYGDFQGLRLSRLGMGNMRLPVRNTRQDGPIHRAEAQKMIDHALAGGINYYDTAYVYHNGESEEFLGDALARHPRESYYLATKYILFSGVDYKAIFAEQRRRLKTDCIDFYLIHAIMDSNYKQYLDSGCIDYFLEQKEKGAIRFLGFSNHASPDVLARFADHHAWDFAQIQLNAYDWILGSAKQEHAILYERGIPIMVMEPVRGGKLATLSPKALAIIEKAARPDWSPASWAFRWIRRFPGIQVIISGMSTIAQIEENVALFSSEASLGDEEQELLFAACRAFHEEVRVACTECRYCCGECPARINIPEILKVYNHYQTDGAWALNEMKGVTSESKTSDCTACSACTARCPQGIDIAPIMAELTDLLSN
ncbi:MAG: aldo/keto reductase [Spirochaetota bacterium]|nr:aldo/keto reductase [Spirochaetota bacterium]